MVSVQRRWLPLTANDSAVSLRRIEELLEDDNGERKLTPEQRERFRRERAEMDRHVAEQRARLVRAEARLRATRKVSDT
jgi:hypothetical protein